MTFEVRSDGLICDGQHGYGYVLENASPNERFPLPWRYRLEGVHSLQDEPYFETREQAVDAALADCEKRFGEPQREAA
ncbi:MAG: hypothetical protein ACR2QF_00435 [Geminicoccaceae bacterium]